MRIFFISLGLFCSLGTISNFAQTDITPVRRAIPVEPTAEDLENLPVRRAVPVSPIDSEPVIAPKPTIIPTAPPRPTPVPTSSPTPAPTPAPLIPNLDAEVDRLAPTNDAPPNPASSDQAQLDFANSFYARKLYDMAAPEYEKYLGLYPHSTGRVTALFRLGESYRTLKNLKAAKNSYQTLLSEFFEGEFIGPAAYRLADLYFQDGDHELALRYYRRASVRIEEPTLSNAAKFYSARCLEKLGMHLEASNAYKDIISLRDKNPFKEAAQFSLGEMLAASGKKNEAVKQFKELAGQTTNQDLKAQATVKAGLVEVELGQEKNATEDLKKALALPGIGPWKGVAQLGLLRLLYQAEKYTEVIKNSDIQKSDLPADVLPEALLLVANSHRQLEKYPQALKVYDQIISEYPESDYSKNAAYERLVTFYAAGDTKLIQEADAYLSAYPKSEKSDRIILLKAESYYKKQAYPEAALIYESLQNSALDSDLKAETLFKLGWCHMQTKAFDLAIKVFSDFLELYPKHSLASTSLAQRAVARQETDDFSSALKDYSILTLKYPKSKEKELALQQKALILGQQQDNKGMADTFRQLLKEFPKTSAAAQAHYWVGWTEFEEKDYNSAIKSLDAARKADKEQFFERATLRIMLSYLNLENTDALAKEVDSYLAFSKDVKVPTEILRWLSGKFYETGSFEGAAKYYAVLTSGKNTSEALPNDWLNLGRSLSKTGKNTEAIEALQMYLSKTKDPFPRSSGLIALGDAQLNANQLDEAQKTVDESLSLQPEGRLNAEGRMLSAEIQMARGNYEQAAKIFASVAVVYEDPVLTPQALEKGYKAFKRAGDDKQASDILNQLQTRFPEYWQQNKTQILAV